MTIDEAIEKERKIAHLHRYNSCNVDAELYADDTEAIEDAKERCIKCAEEHEQLADWLEELKAYKSDDFTKNLQTLVYKQGYNKAIDDFVNVLKEYFVIPHDVRVIEMKAEQLKAGGENENYNKEES